LVDLFERVQVLANDTPRLVGVSIVTNNFGGDHESRDEETVARGTASGGKTLLEAGEKKECSKDDGLR
jgi:hypothetical protein